MYISIIKDLTPTNSNDQIIQDGLINFNVKLLGERSERFSIYLKKDSEILGGAIVWVHSSSIYVDLLWVDESLRGQGYGRKLMLAAEEEGKLRGCKYASVDTYSFQAEEFYLKNGYYVIGKIERHLLEYDKIFFRKELI